jgi:hypothetical protein
VALISQRLKPLTHFGSTLSRYTEEFLMENAQAIGDIGQHFGMVTINLQRA